MNCLSTHPHGVSLFFQGLDQAQKEQKISNCWFKNIVCFGFCFILEALLLHNGLLKCSCNESRLFSILLEFQDGQTYNKEVKEELQHVIWLEGADFFLRKVKF